MAVGSCRRTVRSNEPRRIHPCSDDVLSGKHIWRTFCHINEYDDWGYRNLRRMIAASDPLVIWAPSSQLLGKSSTTKLTPREFLNCVENGAVQVAGREN